MNQTTAWAITEIFGLNIPLDMSDIKFKLEFTARANFRTLEPVTNASYSSFFNTYAAWDIEPTVQRRITPRYRLMLQAGQYAVLATAANPAGTLVKCNDAQIKIYNPTDNISRTADNGYIQRWDLTSTAVPSSKIPNISTMIDHPGGPFDIAIDSTSAGNINGVAVVVSPATDTSTDRFVGFNPNASRYDIFRTIGPEVWSTRTPQSEFNGRYLFTLPYSASIEAHVWGAGGAGGAGSQTGVTVPPSKGQNNGPVRGGTGSPGLYNTTTFTVEAGETIEVFVGQGGQSPTVINNNNENQSAQGRQSPGGAAGASRVSVDGVSLDSFNGGRGGTGGGGRLTAIGGGMGGARYASSFGAGGGGGGGASGILVNDLTVLVAGGGGGGGGGDVKDDSGFAIDNRGPGDKNAAITKNAMINQIAVHSSNYNIDRRDWSKYYFTIGTQVITSTERGHNVAIINSTTLALESYVRFDTWANPWNSGLQSYLNSVGSGKILVLLSADACALSQAERAVLQTKFGSTRTEFWNRLRRGHAFIGIEGGSFAPVEGISDTTFVDISKVVSASVAGDKRGENGQDVASNDAGGGGGGGGGGYPGGQGGANRAGSKSLGWHYGFSDFGATGFYGECGGNFPVYAATTGSTTEYYDARYAQGGAGGAGAQLRVSYNTLPGRGGLVGTINYFPASVGTPGTDGRVVLIVEPIGLMSVKAGGEWKAISNVYYKVSGAWKPVTELFYKLNDEWKQITGGGLIPTPTENTQDYGTNTRPYS